MRKLSNDELNRISIEQFKRERKMPLVIILDNVRSLNNIGSIFRTADAFRIESIYLCGITGTPPHREIQKTALGATESVDWTYNETTQEAIRYFKANYTNGFVYAVEQVDNSIPLNEFIPLPETPLALVFGNEIDGIDEQIIPCVDGCIEIPQFGTKHSLNIAVSAGIVVWEIINKMK